MTSSNCADCGGFDIEWMRQCFTHKGVQFCRACACPFCEEDELDDGFTCGYCHAPAVECTCDGDDSPL